MEISYGILIVFGISVFGGLLSAFVVKKFRIPQVLGYIITGIIIGQSGFKIISSNDIANLAPFNFFALGIIGFLVGTEIKISTLKKYGHQFSAILLAEGILAFLLVGFSVGFILMIVSHNIQVAIAGGLVFGAIASATDPASTLNVLEEYRTAGILTITVIAIVALDDALAMTLYGLGTGIAQMIAGEGTSVFEALFHVFLELFGSIGIGLFFGIIINYILRKAEKQEHSAAATIGLLLLCIGILNQLNLDIILATMATGIYIINKSPRRSREIINYIKSLSIPIYILFFVLVGARLTLAELPFWLWILIITYVIMRSAGKYFGSFIGAKITKSDINVIRYTGLSLFSQGGVAIGLSIMASHHLSNVHVTEDLFLGDVIILGITATTFLVQIIGPSCVKLAFSLAGETDKNITEKDILKANAISANMITNISPVIESTPLREVFNLFSTENINFIPVLSETNKLLGEITINQLKNTIIDQSSWDWLVASDLMSPVNDVILGSDNLYKAKKMIEQIQIENLPVIDDIDSNKYLGVINQQTIKKVVRKNKLEQIYS